LNKAKVALLALEASPATLGPAADGGGVDEAAAEPEADGDDDAAGDAAPAAPSWSRPSSA